MEYALDIYKDTRWLIDDADFCLVAGKKIADWNAKSDFWNALYDVTCNLVSVSLVVITWFHFFPASFSSSCVSLLCFSSCASARRCQCLLFSSVPSTRGLRPSDIPAMHWYTGRQIVSMKSTCVGGERTFWLGLLLRANVSDLVTAMTFIHESSFQNKYGLALPWPMKLWRVLYDLKVLLTFIEIAFVILPILSDS